MIRLWTFPVDVGEPMELRVEGVIPCWDLWNPNFSGMIWVWVTSDEQEYRGYCRFRVRHMIM